MNKLGTVILIIGIFIGVLNVFLFVLWWSLIRIDASAPSEASSYSLDTVSLNLSILQIVLGLVGFVVAVLAFFGFSEVKSVAANKAREIAEKEARDEASKQMESFIRQMQKLGFTEPNGQTGRHAVSRPENNQITEAKAD